MDTNTINILPEETIKEVYKDLAQPTVREVGKFLGRVPAAINAALSSCDQWISKKEYNLKETQKLLELKLENIDPQKIVSPEPYVAVPALQALSYSMDNENLREMYANLLAKAMNVDTKDSVHPSFVDIIKQLSPFDAVLLSKINDYGLSTIPIVKITLQDKINQGEGKLLNHVLYPQFNITIENINNSVISLENFIRLNLIDINYSTCLVNETLYQPLKNNNLINQLKSKHENQNDSIKVIPGIIHLTLFAEAFINICL